MKRLVISITRGVSIAAVVLTLSGPATYGAVHEKETPIKERIIKVVRRAISIVMGDEIIEPKPTPPAP
jgi:hypothetical protein